MSICLLFLAHSKLSSCARISFFSSAFNEAFLTHIILLIEKTTETTDPVHHIEEKNHIHAFHVRSLNEEISSFFPFLARVFFSLENPNVFLFVSAHWAPRGVTYQRVPTSCFLCSLIHLWCRRRSRFKMTRSILNELIHCHTQTRYFLWEDVSLLRRR